MKKNHINLITKTVFCTLFIYLISIGGLVKAGFGITPPIIENNTLLRGMNYEQAVSVGLDKVTQGSKVKFTVDVPGANNWISIDKGVEVPFPVGKNIVDVVVGIKVPIDAEYKNYKGKITATIVPPDLENGVALSVGGEISVNITVTKEKIKDFTVLSYKVPDISEGENLKLVLDIYNKGNIDIAPSRLTLDVYDSSGKTLISSLESTNIKNTVQPSEQGKVIAEIPTNILPAGSYWGDLKIYNDSKVANEFKISIGISPKKEGSLVNQNNIINAVMTALGFGVGMATTFVLLVIVLIILIIILLILRSARRKEAKNRKTKEKK